jgi:hypothetical protein
VIAGQAFGLTITAKNAVGESWQGSVTLSTSAGKLSPQSVVLSQGTATVQTTLTGAAGVVSLTARAGTVSVDASTFALSGEQAVRLEIVPSAFLLTGVGESIRLGVRAFDAAGRATTAQVTWQSLDPFSITVNAGGVATAARAVGSARVIAQIPGVRSLPAVGLVANPKTGALLVADSQVVGTITPEDPAAEYGPGWRYRARLRGVTPGVGQILLARGEARLGGRVVAVSSTGDQTLVTLELLPLNQLFSEVSINVSIPLVDAASRTTEPQGTAPPAGGIRPAAGDEIEFNLAGFKCTASGSAPSLDLPNPSIDLTASLSLNFAYAEALEVLSVTGEVKGTLGYKPVLEAAFEGEVGCERVVRTLILPIGGFLSLILGVQVPIGVGFDLEGNLAIAEVGFDASAEASAQVELGLLCPGGGACSGLSILTTDSDGEFKFISPDPNPQFRVELGASGYAFARITVGSPLSEALQLNAFEAKAGIKQAVNLATAAGQISDPNYASDFELAAFAKAGPGNDLEDAMDKLGDLLGVDLSVSADLLDLETPLARSPRGSFTITPAQVSPGNENELGEKATFTVTLDPVTYFGAYAVDQVEILWKKAGGSGGTVLAPGRPGCTGIQAGAGQTVFTCETDFLEEHLGEQTFYAVVHPKLFGVVLPVPLEVALDAAATVLVGGWEYRHDFETPAGPEWSNSARTTSPSGQTYLGPFNNQSVELRLQGLPVHTKLTVELDLYTILSWDGNNVGDDFDNGPDVITLRLDGTVLKTTTFSNVNQSDHPQAYPGNHPGSSFPAGTGASAINTLGYEPEDDETTHNGDATYRLFYEVDHTGGTVVLRIMGSGLTPIPNEWWGIDNIRVTVR